MNEEQYRVIIIHMVNSIDDMKMLIPIYSYTKVKYEHLERLKQEKSSLLLT